MYLPPGYKESTREEVVETEYGRNVKVTHHFDGSKDATVKVRSLKLYVSSGAPPNREALLAVRELQEATRALAFARQVGRGVGVAEQRLREANQRLLEVQ